MNFFAISKRFNTYDGGYARVTFPEMLVLKENANIKLSLDFNIKFSPSLDYNEGELVAFASGSILPIDRSYRHLSGIIIQRKVKRRKA